MADASPGCAQGDATASLRAADDAPSSAATPAAPSHAHPDAATLNGDARAPSDARAHLGQPPPAKAVSHGGLLVLAALGGAIGSVVRLVLEEVVPPWSCPSDGCAVAQFPAATFIANIVGTAVLGCLLRVALERQWPPAVVTLLGGGFCGGLTTMSTFCGEVVTLFTCEESGAALLYAFSTLTACAAAGHVGWQTGALSAVSGRPTVAPRPLGAVVGGNGT